MSVAIFVTQIQYCEAQGKGRTRGGPRKVTQRSFMDGGWWMVDILSQMLYIKAVTILYFISYDLPHI